MKKRYSCLALISILIFLGSCKKQFSCQCVTTIESPGYDTYTVSSVEKINAKTTKKRATQICAHSEKQLNKNSDDYINPTETLTTSCAVK